MRRISLETLRRDIAIQLTCLRGPTKTALQMRDSEIAVNDAARTIIERCLSNCVILAPDPVQGDRNLYGYWGDSPGKFGETEPWPFEPGHRPPKRSRSER